MGQRRPEIEPDFAQLLNSTQTVAGKALQTLPEPARHPAAHGEADDVRLVDPEMVEGARDVFGEVANEIECAFEIFAVAETAQVRRE